MERDCDALNPATPTRKTCAVACEYCEIKRVARMAAIFQTHPQLSGIIMAGFPRVPFYSHTTAIKPC